METAFLHVEGHRGRGTHQGSEDRLRRAPEGHICSQGDEEGEENQETGCPRSPEGERVGPTSPGGGHWCSHQERQVGRGRGTGCRVFWLCGRLAAGVVAGPVLRAGAQEGSVRPNDTGAARKAGWADENVTEEADAQLLSSSVPPGSRPAHSFSCSFVHVFTQCFCLLVISPVLGSQRSLRQPCAAFLGLTAQEGTQACP